MTEAEAYTEVSTPYTKANRLLQYGGNFLKSAAADRLQGGYRLEYRKFDVTYDFHVDKLYELDAAPGAQPMEITL